MSRYVGVLTMCAGEDKLHTFSPPDGVDAPDVSEWTIEVRYTWTDGTTGFTIPVADISTPDYQVTIPRADTLGKDGMRLRFQSRRVDDGSETELDYGFIDVLP